MAGSYAIKLTYNSTYWEVPLLNYQVILQQNKNGNLINLFQDKVVGNIQKTKKGDWSRRSCRDVGVGAGGQCSCHCPVAKMGHNGGSKIGMRDQAVGWQPGIGELPHGLSTMAACHCNEQWWSGHWSGSSPLPPPQMWHDNAQKRHHLLFPQILLWLVGSMWERQQIGGWRHWRLPFMLLYPS